MCCQHEKAAIAMSEVRAPDACRSLTAAQVFIEESRKPLLDSFLGMCAILGGVYTCSVMLEALLQARSALCAVFLCALSARCAV
jgi:hypothetical protein